MSGVAASVVAASATIVTVLPVFLAGGLAVQIVRDLEFSLAVLGAVTSSFVGAQALLARRLGRWADAIGATRALRGACLLSAASTLAVAGAVRGSIGLAVALAVAGVSNALGQPAANRLLADSVTRGRQGIAFGLFQASKPVAGILAGLAVPTFALTVGWRWAFVAAAGMALAVTTMIPSGIRGDGTRGVGDPPRAPLPGRAWLVVGIALGFGAVKVFSTFLVDAGVAVGLTPATAGLMLTAASALAMVIRIAVGALADRYFTNLLSVVITMMALGTVGFALLIVVEPFVFSAGALVIGVFAWGYNGIFYLAITRMAPEAPASIAGAMLAGASTGGLLLPPIFGLIASEFSYQFAWAVAAICIAAGAAAIRQAAQRADSGKAARVVPG